MALMGDERILWPLRQQALPKACRTAMALSPFNPLFGMWIWGPRGNQYKPEQQVYYGNLDSLGAQDKTAENDRLPV